MNIPWHASQSDIAFMRCGSPFTNRGNSMHYFDIDRVLLDRMAKDGTLYRSGYICGNRAQRLNRLSLWSKSTGLFQLQWGNRCEDCEKLDW